MKTAALALEAIPVRRPVQSIRHQVTVEGGQQLGVTVSGDIESERVLINCLPWSEYTARPDARERYSVMARAAGALVMSVDIPGVGQGNAPLDKKQRQELHDGNVESIVAMQHEALKFTAEREGIYLGNVALFGYSQGTISAAHLEPLLQPSSLILAEPVGITPKNTASFVGSFLHDAKTDAQYKRENPAWFREHLTFELPQNIPSLYAYIQMMARGEHFMALHERPGRKDTIVHGSQSTVSTDDDIARLTQQLPRAEVVQLLGENHSFLNSVGRVAMLLSWLRKQQKLVQN